MPVHPSGHHRGMRIYLHTRRLNAIADYEITANAASRFLIKAFSERAQNRKSVG